MPLILLLLMPIMLFGQYQLSICAIFKNEAPYLKEWIEFHKLQGVQHFYLYNNNSTDHYQTVLKNYLDEGEVTLKDWSFTFEPGVTREWLLIQRNAYNDCLNQFGKETEWLAIIDIDEFLFCPNGTSLVAFLQDYKEFGGVGAHWLQFGTSGIEEIPKNKTLIESLTRCCRSTHPECIFIKSIVQPELVRLCVNSHYCVYKKGYRAVGAEKNVISTGRTEAVSHDKIRVNHYWTRTSKHFREKKIACRHNRRAYEQEFGLQMKADSFNVVTNSDILQFVPALRKQLGYP